MNLDSTFHLFLEVSFACNACGVLRLSTTVAIFQEVPTVHLFHGAEDPVVSFLQWIQMVAS